MLQRCAVGLRAVCSTMLLITRVQIQETSISPPVLQPMSEPLFSTAEQYRLKCHHFPTLPAVPCSVICFATFFSQHCSQAERLRDVSAPSTLTLPIALKNPPSTFDC